MAAAVARMADSCTRRPSEAAPFYTPPQLLQHRRASSPALLPAPPLRQQPRRPSHGRASQLTARSFMGSIDLVGSWLMPSWLLSDAEDGPRYEHRQKRLRQLRRLLKSSLREPALVLPPVPGEEGVGCAVAGSGGDEASAGNSGNGGGTLDVAHSASNAVPFTAGASAACVAASSLTVALNGGAASVCRADEVRQVLPWLFVAEGRLDFSAMEHVASQLALSALQLLDVTRFAAASGAANGHWHSSWGAHVRWAGPQALPSAAVAAAAALRRMEMRRGGALSSLPEMEGKAVVLTFHPHHRQLAAETLAIYLHAYLGLSGQEAVAAAGRVVGTSPLECTLRQAMEELATIADGWYRRVTLAWPYAGGHVEVVGDAVGGWDQRAPMVFNVKKKRWQLQIWGLQPGIHRFKYLVDGCWVIDLAGHTEADSKGNINNVVMVTAAGKPLLRPRGAGDSMSSTDEGNSSSSSSSSSSGEGGAAGAEGQQLAEGGGSGAGGSGAAAVQQPQPAVLATAEPPDAEVEAAAAAAAVSLQQPPPAWRSPQEMEGMARFGAAIVAFHTRLGLQLRHKLH